MVLTGSMPSDAHCAGVGWKRAARLAWLETSVSAAAVIFGLWPSRDQTKKPTAAAASTATTISEFFRPRENKLPNPELPPWKERSFVACIADLPVPNS